MSSDKSKYLNEMIFSKLFVYIFSFSKLGLHKNAHVHTHIYPIFSSVQPLNRVQLFATP